MSKPLDPIEEVRNVYSKKCAVCKLNVAPWTGWTSVRGTKKVTEHTHCKKLKDEQEKK